MVAGLSAYFLGLDDIDQHIRPGPMPIDNARAMKAYLASTSYQKPLGNRDTVYNGMIDEYDYDEPQSCPITPWKRQANGEVQGSCSSGTPGNPQSVTETTVQTSVGVTTVMTSTTEPSTSTTTTEPSTSTTTTAAPPGPTFCFQGWNSADCTGTETVSKCVSDLPVGQCFRVGSDGPFRSIEAQGDSNDFNILLYAGSFTCDAPAAFMGALKQATGCSDTRQNWDSYMRIV